MSYVSLRSGLGALCLAGAAALIGAVPAEAAKPKRTYNCGDGAGSLVVTVLSQQSIRVRVDLGGEDGKFTMTMKQSGSGYHFVDGEYEVTITNAQDTLTYMAPDYGSIACVWGGH